MTKPNYDLRAVQALARGEKPSDDEKSCSHCGKQIPSYRNYCGWDCMVAEAKKNGGRVHTPNGLPIRCLNRDGTMLEHAHGDHPDYKFPVDVEFVGEVDEGHRDDYVNMTGSRAKENFTDEDVRKFFMETHALIYTDTSIALTMYECTYALFELTRGELFASSLSYLRPKVSPHRPQYQLTTESLNKVRRAGELWLEGLEGKDQP